MFDFYPESLKKLMVGLVPALFVRSYCSISILNQTMKYTTNPLLLFKVQNEKQGTRKKITGLNKYVKHGIFKFNKCK